MMTSLAVQDKVEEKIECRKAEILHELRSRGCRITRQRKVILDIMLRKECSSCKEICYYASKFDDSIGQATVYRMINVLEDMNVINRRSLYRVNLN